MRLLVEGGASAHELAAITAAIESLIGDETSVPGDPLPPVYRSKWREAAIHEGTLAFEYRAD